MQSTLTGIVHGRAIELETNTNFPDGARVRISLKPAEHVLCGDEARAAILDSAGGWADADDHEFARWTALHRDGRR